MVERRANNINSVSRGVTTNSVTFDRPNEANIYGISVIQKCRATRQRPSVQLTSLGEVDYLG